MKKRTYLLHQLVVDVFICSFAFMYLLIYLCMYDFRHMSLPHRLCPFRRLGSGLTLAEGGS